MPSIRSYEDLQQFLNTKITDEDQFEKLRKEADEAVHELAGVEKELIGIRSWVRSKVGKQQELKARISEINYLIREYGRSPYSPQKSHFRVPVGQRAN